MKFFRNTNSLLGIDISDTNLHVVELKRVKQEYTLISASSIPIIINDTLSVTESKLAALKKVSAMTQTKIAVIALPYKDVLIKELTINQSIPKSQLVAYVYNQAAQLSQHSLTELCVDFNIISRTPLKILLVAAKRKQIENYIRLFALAGLTLVAVRVDVLALQKILQVNRAMEIFINITERTVQLVTRTTQHENFIYEKSHQGNMIDEAVMQLLTQYQVEHPGKEINNIWLAAKNSQAIIAKITAIFNSKIHAFNLFEFFKTTPYQDNVIAGYTFAISYGLAL